MEDNSFKNKIKANIFPIVVIGMGILLIAGGLFYSLNKNKNPVISFEKDTWNEDGTLKEGVNCQTEVQTLEVPAAGSDIFAAGTEIEVEMNYYACNRAARNEIVMIKSPGREDPIFKYIKMLPGDKYSVEEVKNNRFKVVINGEDMQNSKGETYSFTERKSRMIKLYESNFKEGIKTGVYFVFGDSPGGGFDSTRFGPVTSERMVGRVLTKPSEK